MASHFAAPMYKSGDKVYFKKMTAAEIKADRPHLSHDDCQWYADVSGREVVIHFGLVRYDPDEEFRYRIRRPDNEDEAGWVTIALESWLLPARKNEVALEVDDV